MAWIELHQSLWTHRKTLALAEALGIEDTYAAAHMARFWSWAMDNACNGDITVMSQTIIAKAAGWHGDAKTFTEAIVASGFFDRDDRGVRIHNWDNYSGKLMEARAKNKDRQRRYRGRNANITVTSPLDNGLVTPLPYPTVPNRTQPDRTRVENGYTNEHFNAFWEIYPRKVNKANAEKAWGKLKPSAGLVDEILTALTAQAASPRWQAEPQFIPHAATWLNGHRWEDEVDVVTTEIDELFREKMREKYRGVLTEIDERIDEALAHQSAKKWTDLQRYVSGWLRRDGERGPTTRVEGYHKPEDFAGGW